MILKYVVFRISFSLIRNYLGEELILLLLPRPELMLLVFSLLTEKEAVRDRQLLFYYL